MIESLLLSVTRIQTLAGATQLTNATGFFFQTKDRLFLITNRHVVLDEPSNHHPDRLEIEFHVDPDNVAAVTQFSIPLYQGGKSVWRQGTDSAGPVDVIALEINRSALPATAFFQPFSPAHLVKKLDQIEVGTQVLIVGFPLGFHDTLHHLPVARQATIASAFGIRFQGQGYFLTDGRLHRGTSGAPVVVRVKSLSDRGDLAWSLLGVHSARLESDQRDVTQDERLELNCAWYADMLLTLVEDRPQPQGKSPGKPTGNTSNPGIEKGAQPATILDRP